VRDYALNPLPWIPRPGWGVVNIYDLDAAVPGLDLERQRVPIRPPAALDLGTLQLGGFPQVCENSGPLLPILCGCIASIIGVLFGDSSGPVLVDPWLLNEEDVEMVLVGKVEGDIVSCPPFAHIDLHDLQGPRPDAMPVAVHHVLILRMGMSLPPGRPLSVEVGPGLGLGLGFCPHLRLACLS
jgi:hypothetical protein